MQQLVYLPDEVMADEITRVLGLVLGLTCHQFSECKWSVVGQDLGCGRRRRQFRNCDRSCGRRERRGGRVVGP